MPDPRFFLTGAPMTASSAAAAAGATLLSGADGRISRVGGLDEADISDAVIFVEKAVHGKKLERRRVGLCLTSEQIVSSLDIEGAVAVMDSPRLGFARVATLLHSERPFEAHEGVHASAKIGAGVSLGDGAVIGEDVEIGEGSEIGPHVVIGPAVVIGAGARIGASVTISHSMIGARVKILAGARVGEPGFGFVPGREGLVRTPQLGRVVIGDDVEIGANSTIDRGALGDTMIADGVKIDNLVQIGHNVKIGRFSVIAAQCGISGSSVIGAGVMMGGQAGLADHLEIGDGAQIAAKAGVMSNVPAGEIWGGYPARPMRKWLRGAAALSKMVEARSAKKNA